MTWASVKKSPGFEFMALNAMEELDEPGEWYVNRRTSKIYYYPAVPDQDMNTVESWVPATEFLVCLRGTPGSKVRDLTLQGIDFRFGNWKAPQHRFLGRTQAEIDEMYQSEIPGQIILDQVDRIVLRDCRVTHMASVGIQAASSKEMTRSTPAPWDSSTNSTATTTHTRSTGSTT